MPFFSASVNESLTSSTSTVTGHIALQGTAPVVTGVAIAGRTTGHVGTLVTGIYGALKVNANGTFSYVLDNTNPNTAILATGEQAHDHFEVTAVEGSKTVVILVDIAITGAGNPSITTTNYAATLDVSNGTVLPAGNRLVFSAGTGVELNYTPFMVNTVTNDGSIAVVSGGLSSVYAASATGPGMYFVNNGRITARSSNSTISNLYEIAALFAGGGTNTGVVSTISRLGGTAPPTVIGMAAGDYFDRAPAINSGLVESIGKGQAYGVKADGGDFTNTGEVFASGQQGTVYGYYSGQSAGFVLTNSGTIMAAAAAKTAKSVGIYDFPDSSNPLSPVTIDNSGTIVGQTAILIDGGYSVASYLTNSGSIQGNIQLGPGDNLIDNTQPGRILGNISFTDTQAGNSNVVDNAGVIKGNITFGGATGIYIGVGKGRLTGAVSAGSGDALLIGGDVADHLVGGSGTDWFVGGRGADVMTGGTNANTYIYRAMTDSTAMASDTITNFVSGRDVLDLSALGVSSFTLTAMGGYTQLSATQGTKTLVIHVDGTIAAGDVITSGTPSGDSNVAFAPGNGGTLNGGTGTNIMVGLGGDDTFNAGSGPQQIMIGGSGHNTFNVANSTDRVIAQTNALSNVINTTAGILMPANVTVVNILGDQPLGVTGNGLADVITMNNAGDYFAGAGHDTVYAGAGADFIFMGKDSRVVYNSAADSTAAAQDVIVGFTPGSDTIDLSALGVTSVAITDFPTSSFVYYGAGAPNPEYVYSYFDVVAQTANGAMSLMVSTNAMGFGMGDIIL